MNRFMHELYDRYKKPIIYILGFFLGIFFMDHLIDGGFLLKDYVEKQDLVRQRMLSDDGAYDLSGYDVDTGSFIDLGAAFADKVLNDFVTNSNDVISLLEQDILTSRGYELNPAAFENAIAAVSQDILSGNYELCYQGYFDKLASGGIVFDFCLIKLSDDGASEQHYDAFDRKDMSMTIYFEEGVPVRYLPFPEPALHSYASSFGFIKN